jgi:hypothetical protein
MRITIRSGTQIEETKASPPLPQIVRALDGVTIPGANLSQHLDSWLADLGIIGGTVRLVRSGNETLDVIVVYWAPQRLSQKELAALVDAVKAQWSDGFGEGGFNQKVGNTTVCVTPSEDGLVADQVEDGKEVQLPSLVARGARDGDLEAMKKGIALGEDIDARFQECPALHWAILFRHLPEAIWLLKLGANPNALDKEGHSSLHLAVLANRLSDNESLELVRHLLAHGADPAALTKSGQTAAYYARNRKKLLTLAALESHKS